MNAITPIAIGCSNLSKRFHYKPITSRRLQDALLGQRKPGWSVDALRSVTVEVRQGEWLGIAGHNGSGKTTLLRILGGLLFPDSGNIHRQGTVSCFFGVGAGFHPDLTLAENVYLHNLLHELPTKEARGSCDAVIRDANLQSYRDVPLKCLSLGMLVRLGFTSAMAINRDIYLLDEIVAVGDEAFQKHSMQKLLDLKKQGKTAIIVSHNPIALESLCDRTLTMRQGEIISSNHHV